MGTAEAVYNPSMGLICAVMPITATMCFIIGEISSQSSVEITQGLSALKTDCIEEIPGTLMLITQHTGGMKMDH